VAERVKKKATAGTEDCGDDNDPFSQLMEDFQEEIKDFEAVKTQKVDVNRSKEASLVAGGKALHDKAAQQIFYGETVAISGTEPALLQHYPACSVCDIDAKMEPSTASSKKCQAHDHFFVSLTS
jgi:hypothetical protein